MTEEIQSRDPGGRSGDRYGLVTLNKKDTDMNDDNEKTSGETSPLTKRAIRRKIKRSNEASKLKKADSSSVGKALPTAKAKTKKTFFVLCLGASALVVAGCAAFFSVRGISLLFAGSMLAVTIMASGLEYGKLVAASYLYRYWSKTSFLLKSYLMAAVIVLVGITSMGIYGFLSDAFEKTKTKVHMYEATIATLEDSNEALELQMNNVQSSAADVSDKADSAIDSYKKIYDEFIEQQNSRRSSLIARRSILDEAVTTLEESPGGLFSSKKKKLEELKESQKLERDSITSSLSEIETQNRAEYESFTSKVESYRTRSEEASDELDITDYQSKIEVNRAEILNQKELIAGTDIGSFKFIANSFNQPLEDVVKWFILFIVIVFDPLSVTLVLAYNVALKHEEDK